MRARPVGGAPPRRMQAAGLPSAQDSCRAEEWPMVASHPKAKNFAPGSGLPQLSGQSHSAFVGAAPRGEFRPQACPARTNASSRSGLPPFNNHPVWLVVTRCRKHVAALVKLALLAAGHTPRPIPSCATYCAAWFFTANQTIKPLYSIAPARRFVARLSGEVNAQPLGLKGHNKRRQ